MKEDHAILSCQHLSVGYKKGASRHSILGDLNLSLRKGEVTCLMGKNGSGKSTLIRTLAGIQEGLSGEIFVENSHITALSSNEKSRKISVVLTDRDFAGNLTAGEVITMGRYPYTGWFGAVTSEDESAVRESAEAVGVLDLLDEKVHELSDGQLQRVLICRALTQNGHIMILDEPTSHLDLNNRIEVFRLLKNLANAGKGILISTHELDLALQFCDRVWLIKPDGSISVGLPEDLVLDGSFDRTFELKGYDLKTGKVDLDVTRALLVKVVGKGSTLLWTKNALERMGFQTVPDLDPNDKGDLHVVIDEEEGAQLRWIIKQSGVEDLPVSSLEELVSRLLSRG